jgi:hypothetical protein
LAEGATVPIGWVAVGDPAQLFSPDQHEAIWAVQRELNFPLFVYGTGRDTPELMQAITRRLSVALGAHRIDRSPEDLTDS